MEEKKSELDTPKGKVEVTHIKLGNDKKGSYLVGSFDTKTGDSHETKVEFDAPCDNLNDLTDDTEVKVTQITTNSNTTATPNSPNSISGGILQDNSFSSIPDDTPKLKVTLNDGTSTEKQVQDSKTSGSGKDDDLSKTYYPPVNPNTRFIDPLEGQNNLTQLQDNDDINEFQKEKSASSSSNEETKQSKTPIPNKTSEKNDEALNHQLNKLLESGRREGFNGTELCNESDKRVKNSEKVVIRPDGALYGYTLPVNSDHFELNEKKKHFDKLDSNGWEKLIKDMLQYDTRVQDDIDFFKFVHLIYNFPQYLETVRKVIGEENYNKAVLAVNIDNLKKQAHRDVTNELKGLLKEGVRGVHNIFFKKQPKPHDNHFYSEKVAEKLEVEQKEIAQKLEEKQKKLEAEEKKQKDEVDQKRKEAELAAQAEQARLAEEKTKKTDTNNVDSSDSKEQNSNIAKDKTAPPPTPQQPSTWEKVGDGIKNFAKSSLEVGKIIAKEALQAGDALLQETKKAGIFAIKESAKIATESFIEASGELLKDAISSDNPRAHSMGIPDSMLLTIEKNPLFVSDFQLTKSDWKSQVFGNDPTRTHQSHPPAMYVSSNVFSGQRPHTFNGSPYLQPRCRNLSELKSSLSNRVNNTSSSSSSSSSKQKPSGRGKRTFSDRHDDGSSSSTLDDTVYPVSKKPALETTSNPPIVTTTTSSSSSSSSPSSSSTIAPESVGMEGLHFTTQESISLELNRIRSEVETLKQNFGDVYQAKVAYDVTGSLAKVARFYQQNGNLEKAELFTKITSVFCDLAKKSVPYIKAIGTAIDHNSTNFQQQFDHFTYDPIGTTAEGIQQLYYAYIESRKLFDPRNILDQQFIEKQQALMNLMQKKIQDFANLPGPKKLEKATEFTLGLFTPYALLVPLGLANIPAIELATLSEASQTIYGALKLECINARDLALQKGFAPSSLAGLTQVIREFPETLAVSLGCDREIAKRTFDIITKDSELLKAEGSVAKAFEKVANIENEIKQKNLVFKWLEEADVMRDKKGNPIPNTEFMRETFFDDKKIKVIFRRDIGEGYAHKITSHGYLKDVDHYNIEIQQKGLKNFERVYNRHIIVDQNFNVIEVFD